MVKPKGTTVAKRAVEMLLDSGAYTSWTAQETINVKDYIRFVKQWQHLLWGYINLDVLPGKYGIKRGPNDVKEAATASYKNFRIMKEAGLNPIPVFHRGESFKVLEDLLRDGESYIGLSPLVDSKDLVKMGWLDQCFTLLTDSQGRPLVKTHGFGVTSMKLMFRYPWHTVDSTSWVKSGGFGIISIPPLNEDGTDNYADLPNRVRLSDTIRQKTNGTTFDKLGPMLQKRVIEWLTKHGFDLAAVRHSRSKRCNAMLAYLNHLEGTIHKPFRERAAKRFDSPFDCSVLPSKATQFPFYVFHSTNISNDQGSLLTEQKCRYRLLSYYELREVSPAKIEQYVKYGVEPGYERRQPAQNWDSGYKSFRTLKLLKRLENADNETQGLGGAD